jgi:hypothetical protein
MTTVHKVTVKTRSIVRRIPGVRPAWHALLRINGRVHAAVEVASQSSVERRRRVREARPIDYPTRRTRADLVHLELRNLLSRRTLTSSSGDAVVTMTTHGERVERVYLALESIGRGKELPGRIILWLDDAEAFETLPRALRRLQRRGLEVRLSDRYRVHTKYYPYVVGFADAEAPLVTADDDILYPDDWLSRLMSAHRSHPDDIIAFRAHRMSVEGGRITPYATWPPASGFEAHSDFFGTSVSGQVFPAALLRLLRERGEAFQTVSPDNDDIWIHSVAVDAGFRLRLADGESRLFPFVPGTQQAGLYLVNYWDGGNDRQIAAAYSAGAIAAIGSDRVGV